MSIDILCIPDHSRDGFILSHFIGGGEDSRKARRRFAPGLRFGDILDFVVPGRGLEPPQITLRAPKARAATNYATPARGTLGYSLQ